jgi:hypothetical protein
MVGLTVEMNGVSLTDAFVMCAGTMSLAVFSEKVMTKITEHFLVDSDVIIASRFTMERANSRAVPNRGIVAYCMKVKLNNRTIAGEF